MCDRRREMPELEGLYRQYQKDPNVIFWAVDVQKNGETPKRVFLQKAGYALPMAWTAGTQLIDSRSPISPH